MQADCSVNLFPTCVVDAVGPDVGFATSHVLERTGCTVVVPEDATCCGQPAWNAGQSEAAARVARTTLRALAGTDGDIVVPSGSCATMIRTFWRELFELHGDLEDRTMVEEVALRTREFAEFIHERGVPPGVTDEEVPHVYHRSCHMLRELEITTQPEEVLDVYVADRRRTASEGRCCGFGGLFAVKLPETSVAMADEVLDALEASGAQRVVACDMSCLMHLAGRAGRREMTLEFEHLAQTARRATGGEE